ncbi:uncharacterized protein LOC129255975 [Lytechinus pictus]|uniref:uncharacterized protein LOC129255975 n=1 Tax=Lytechinus pictus TaxID=7653 RepID=UPI0030B9EE1A
MARVVCVTLLILASSCVSGSDPMMRRQHQRGTGYKERDNSQFISPESDDASDSDSSNGNGSGASRQDNFLNRHAHLQWKILSRKIQVGTANLNSEHSNKFPWKANDHKTQENQGQDGNFFHEHDARLGKKDVFDHDDMDRSSSSTRTSKDFIPGQNAKSFSVETLNGTLQFPSAVLLNKSIIFHVFDNRSGFLECFWTSEASLKSISSSPESLHYVFMSASSHAKQDALWMQNQIMNILQKMTSEGELRQKAVCNLQARLHFVTQPTYELGNWLPAVLMEWACQDHGCGFSQAVFKSITGSSSEVILKRLDARYDWLPSPAQVFSSPQSVVLAGNGCSTSEYVAGRIALVVDGDCSFADKVKEMEASSAVGVIVYSQPGYPVQDMNCEGAECDDPPSIPATMIPYNQALLQSVQKDSMNVSFQTSPSENFYFAIDQQGKLAELGWLLYPSFQFFVWQAQWFDYKTELKKNLSQEVTVVPVINDTIMQGHAGVVQTVDIPSLQDVSKIELDTSLSCPGTRDESCPPWDHTVQLYLCCDQTSPLCGMELGRWITAFRRRIGRWLTDVTPLTPLFTSSQCTFTMKTAWWAQPWKPSLSLRLHKSAKVLSEGHPRQILPLFRGGTFNQSYNTQYHPINFTVPQTAKKVILYAVITGHGSDNNGCGEFCVTSHHFIVNGHPNVNTFTNAGTPNGCAERSITGVEPNEHGTWLYGRDGWCDGREVDPWVVDVTSQVNMEGSNSIKYFGWFNGTDPDPTANPGVIIMYSYLVMYN